MYDRQFQPGMVLGSLAVSFGMWIIVGGFGYSGWPKASYDNPEFLEVATLTFSSILYFLGIFFAHGEYTLHPSPAVASSAIFTAAVLSASITVAFCISTADARNVFQSVFLVMGSVYVGCLGEVATGFFTRSLRGPATAIQTGERSAARQETQANR